MISFWRIIKSGLQNYYRSLGSSIGTTIVMILTLFTISAIFLLNVLAGIAISSVQEKVDVSVYFNTNAQASAIFELKDKVERLPEVRETGYISKEQALADFRQKHSDNNLVLQSLEELDENPLQPVLVIKAHEPSQYEGIVAYLENETGGQVLSEKEAETVQSENVADIPADSGIAIESGEPSSLMSGNALVDKISYEDNREIIARLNSITSVVRKAGIGVGAFFGVVALLVMFNTIRMTIVAKKDEISIMRLVGAKNGFIHWPFIVTGMLYGVFATVITLAVLYPAIFYLSPRISRFFEGFGEELVLYFESNFALIFLGLLGVGLLLGVISSSTAIRKYLKV